VSPRNGAGLAPSDRCKAGILDAWQHSVFSRPNSANQAQALRAELTGNTCVGAGITVRSGTPVIELCRRALAAGLDPALPMEVFRNGTLALRVRSIGEAAGLRVNSKGTGFVRLEAVPTGPSVRQNQKGGAS
jgi:hypothetical protein